MASEGDGERNGGERCVGNEEDANGKWQQRFVSAFDGDQLYIHT